MGTFFLQTGLVVSRQGQTLEYVSRAENELYFDEPMTGRRITLTEPRFWSEFQTNALSIVDAFSSPKLLRTPPPETAAAQFKNLADLPEKYQRDTERKVIYITRLKEAGITQGQKRLISIEAPKIAAAIGDHEPVPGTSTIQKWWKELGKANGEVYVLVSGHAQRNRRKGIDAESETFLQEQIDDEFAVDTRPTAVSAYRAYRYALKRKNTERAAALLPLLTAVSERTFYNRIEERPKKELMIARLGREAARHHFKMIKGHLPAEHPLDVVEIDHTPMNLYVIDDQAFLPLGRPWLTAIKDRYSGVLLGFYVSFQATGLDSVFGAIKHSLRSHHLAYELWPEIENPWPSFGRGHFYASDRGADFLSQRYRTAIISLGGMYEYCERRTPWLKGSIERFFLTLEQTFFEAMPGRTFASLKDRGDYNPVKDAVVRFSTLIFLLHKWAADYHNIIPHKRTQARSIDLWQDGIGIAPPPYHTSPDTLNIILGEHHTGKLTQEGIRFSWLTYADDQLSALMDEVDKGVSVNFVVSRENLGHIHVQHPRSNEYLCIPSTRPEYSAGLSLFQHKYLRKEAGVRFDKASAVDTLIETRAAMAETIQGELQAKSTKGKKRLAQIAGINSEAVLRGEARTIQSPFAGQQVAVPADPPSIATLPTFTNVPNYAWGI